MKKGGDFVALAKEFSIDQAAETGGELGWFTEATALRGVNEDFKKAVFSTDVNKYAIVKSLYGTHIIKVTDKTSKVDKYKVADIDMTVSPSSKTYGNIYNELNQFISKNQDSSRCREPYHREYKGALCDPDRISQPCHEQPSLCCSSYHSAR